MMKYDENKIREATRTALFDTFKEFDKKETIFDLNILKNLVYILQHGIGSFHNYREKGYFMYHFLKQFDDENEFVLRFSEYKHNVYLSEFQEHLSDRIQYMDWVNSEIEKFKVGAFRLLLNYE